MAVSCRANGFYGNTSVPKKMQELFLRGKELLTNFISRFDEAEIQGIANGKCTLLPDGVEMTIEYECSDSRDSGDPQLSRTEFLLTSEDDIQMVSAYLLDFIAIRMSRKK